MRSVTGGQSLHAAWQLLCTEPCRPFGLSAWIVVFSSVQLFLSQVSSPSHSSCWLQHTLRHVKASEIQGSAESEPACLLS